MADFSIGFVAGVVVSGTFFAFACWAGSSWEWKQRRKVERDVSKLMRAFACGQGFVGCTGGPRCTSSHK